MLIIFIIVVGMLAGCIFKTELLEKPMVDILKNYDVERVFLRGTLQLYWNFVLDCIFAFSTALIPRVFLKSSQSVVGILLVVFSSMINEDLVPFWKVGIILVALKLNMYFFYFFLLTRQFFQIFAVSTVILAIVIRYIAKERLKKRCVPLKLNCNFQNRYFDSIRRFPLKY